MSVPTEAARHGGGEEAPGAARRLRVLIAEDERHLGTLLEHFLVARGLDVAVARDGREALARLRGEPFDVALLDVQMPGIDGLGVLQAVRAEPLPPEVVIITGNGTIDTAIKALRLGAFDYLAKPYRMAEIEILVRRAADHRTALRELAALRASAAAAEDALALETVYAPLRAALDAADAAAPSMAPVVIVGEPGTGAEALGRRLHDRACAAGTRGGSVVAVDCRALDAASIDGALFGAARAVAAPGAVALAAHGTLLLLGAERLPAAALERLVALGDAVDGDDAAAHTAPRVVCCVARVGDGASRGAARWGDASWRAAHGVALVELPPLRRRAGDVRLLAEAYARRWGGARAPRVLPAAVEALERRAWPGNVEELSLVMRRAVLAAGDAPAIEPAHLDVAQAAPATAAPRATPARVADAPVERRAAEEPRPAVDADVETLDALERRQIARALETAGWHQGHAAALLGISPRTLYRKIRRLGLQRPGRAPRTPPRTPPTP